MSLPTAEMILGDNYDSSRDNTVTYTYGDNQIITEDTVISENMTVNCAIEGISAVTLTNVDITLTEFAYNDVPYILPKSSEKLIGKYYYPNVFNYTVNYTDTSGNPITETSVIVNDNTIFNFRITSDFIMKGDGTEDKPYIIETADGLCYFRDMVNIGNTDICGKLTADIDMSVFCGKDIGSWVPIGNFDYAYWGTFNGNGYTISGLYIDDANAELAGLFGYTEGKISDLVIVDSFIKGRDFVGGVCGKNSGTIMNCYNTSEIISNFDAGGICGYNGGPVQNCYNTGSITGAGEEVYVGGICGYSYNEIKNCYNTGMIIATGDYIEVGGLCGENAEGTIENCYNTGMITASGDQINAGGLCGINSGTTTTTNSYYLEGCNSEGTTFTNDAETSKTAEEMYSADFCELITYHSHQNEICTLCKHAENGVGVYGQSVTLDGTIGMNIYVAANDDCTDWTAGFNGVEVAAPEKDAKGLYKFTFNVAPKDMAQEITFSINGEEKAVVSVMSYLDELQANAAEGTPLADLADSMSSYCIAAKAYFNGDDVAEQSVTDDMSDYAFAVGTMPEGLTYYGSSLILESETTVRHYFTIAEGYDTADFAFTVNGSEASLTESEKNPGYYFIDIKNISAEKLGVSYTVSINGEDIITGYSALSYAKKVLDSDKTDVNLKNLVKALYIYNQNALAYNNPNADAA